MLTLLFTVTLYSQTPVTPSNLVTRSGDRSITLHWDSSHQSAISGFDVYRSESKDGFYQKISIEPLHIQSFADLQVENGKTYFYKVDAFTDHACSELSSAASATPKPFHSHLDFLEYLQGTAFDYFWYEANPSTGLIRDRSQPKSPSSIAGVGFGLTAIALGVDHNWITRDQGRDRVLRALTMLWNAPQGQATTAAGYKGWFYHFLQMDTALRYRSSELSSMDTALLLAGVLYCAEYFNSDQADEVAIRALAQKIYDRVDWQWMLDGGDTLSMGWTPESGFISARWKGYNEASILYILGLGAKTNNLTRAHWNAWTRTYNWKKSYGYTFIHFPPLFGHQYSGCWIDFRTIIDDYVAAKDITYFENSRRATLAQRNYSIANPKKHLGYGTNIWGLTACDGPGFKGYQGYAARGAPPPENDDGTLAPTAAGGSLVFTPQESIEALRFMYQKHRVQIWTGYGFRDAFNLEANWWDPDVLAIDQGPILLMAENLRTQRVWDIMRKSPVLRRGLDRAGFRPLQH